MALPDSEHTIAGKTHSEILAMKGWTRSRWYKTVSSEKRMEIMRVVDVVRRAKISASKMGHTRSKESCAKQSATITGRVLTEEHKAKISASKMGRPRSEETKAKISAILTGENHPHFGKTFSEETRAKMSTAQIGKYTGENNSNWRGGISFLPYCPAFNEQLKESIRNRDNRTCVLCGKGGIQNGQRLSVHHIDSDKAQGCNHKSWYLCALCRSCNSRPDTVEKEFLIVTNQNRIGGIR